MSPASSSNGRALAFAALILGACAIGTAAPLVRLAEVEGVGPQAAAFWRMTLALPVLTVLALAEPRSENKANGHGLRWALLAGLFFFGDLAFWHAGIVLTTTANATLLANMAPVVVVVFAWLVLKERIGGGLLAGLAAALAGAVLLSGANFYAAPERLTGDALSAFTALWYAAYMLAVKAARAAWSTARVMAVSTAVGVPLLLATALIFRESIIPPTATAWLWIALLALFAHVSGQGAIAYGFGRLPAALSSIVVLVQPVVSAALGWAIFGEALGWPHYVGAGLVLAGVVMAQRAGRDATPPPQGVSSTPPSG